MNHGKLKKSKEIFNNIYDGEEIDYTLETSAEDEDVIISEEKYNLIPGNPRSAVPWQPLCFCWHSSRGLWRNIDTDKRQWSSS